jgi:hypothetical protein
MIVAPNRLLACAAAVLLIAACVADVQAQRGRRGQGQPGQRGFGGRGGPGFGGGGFGGGPLEVLQRTDVQQELEMVPSQTEAVAALAEEQAGARQQLFGQGQDLSRLRDASPEERGQFREQMQQRLQQRNAEVMAKIKLFLLPHQLTRFEELLIQWETRRGLDRALTSGVLAAKLGVTEAHKQQFEAKREEVAAIRRQMEEHLRKEIEALYLGALTTDQRAQYEKAAGEPFQFQPIEGGFGGDRRGGGRRGQRPDA